MVRSMQHEQFNTSSMVEDTRVSVVVWHCHYHRHCLWNCTSPYRSNELLVMGSPFVVC